MRARFAAIGVLAVLHVAAPLRAQSVSIDEEHAPAVAPAPLPTPPKPPAPEPIIPPRALSTPISYPARGSGEQEVVLELTIAKDGRVTSALDVDWLPARRRRSLGNEDSGSVLSVSGALPRRAVRCV